MENSRDSVKSGLVDPLDYRTLNFDVLLHATHNRYSQIQTNCSNHNLWQSVGSADTSPLSVQTFLLRLWFARRHYGKKYFNMAGEFVFRWPLYNDYKELTCHRLCSRSGWKSTYRKRLTTKSSILSENNGIVPCSPHGPGRETWLRARSHGSSSTNWAFPSLYSNTGRKALGSVRSVATGSSQLAEAASEDRAEIQNHFFSGDLQAWLDCSSARNWTLRWTLLNCWRVVVP